MKNGKKLVNGIVPFSAIDLTGSDKVAPHAIDVEKDVLGAIMMVPGSFELADKYLKTSDAFHKLEHKEIYEAMADLTDAFQIADPTAVVQQLVKRGKLEFVGGAYYVVSLTNSVIGAKFLERDCLILREKYLRRTLISLGATFFRSGFDETTDTLDLLDYAETMFDELVNGLSHEQYKPASLVAGTVLDEIEQLMKKEVEFTGVPSGYPTLDKATCGWQATDLIIIAARPSVGKTAFALNLARNPAKLGKKIGVFSLEMSNKQLVKRLLATSSQVRLDKINRGRVSESELKQILISSGHPEFENILIDDTAGLGIFDFRAKARRMANEGVEMIIIDYLQLMTGSGKEGNREQEISSISRNLKKTAKELNIPIIALSQLSREIEKRGGGEPKLSDLRESGAVEQDADVVGFLTRDDYQQSHADGEQSNKGWLKIKKHRNGILIDIPFITKFETQEWLEDIPELNIPTPRGFTHVKSFYEKSDDDFDTGMDIPQPF